MSSFSSPPLGSETQSLTCGHSEGVKMHRGVKSTHLTLWRLDSDTNHITLSVNTALELDLCCSLKQTTVFKHYHPSVSYFLKLVKKN